MSTIDNNGRHPNAIALEEALEPLTLSQQRSFVNYLIGYVSSEIHAETWRAGIDAALKSVGGGPS